MIRKSIALLVSTSLLSGCYSFRGPEPVLSHGRVVENDGEGPRSGFLYERFRQATLRASGCADPGATQWADPISPTTPLVCLRDPVDQTEIDDFMQAGYDLIYADCANYFAHMGRRQSGSRLIRDTITPISTLISGIISIVRFQDSNTRDDLLASLALATTAGSSAIDVYDQHFLFGADNIDAVRGLVQDALTAHANRTFSSTVNHSTFGRAASHLEDNQALCRPTHILSLVRAAIAAGTIEARTPSQTTKPDPSATSSTTTTTTTTTGADAAATSTRETTSTTTPSRPTTSDRVSVGVVPPR